jgi:hypothetical protein
MDLEGIFGLFGFSEENNKKKLKELEALKDTPRFKLGMFHKLVMNSLIFKKQTLKFFSKSSPKLDLDDIDTAGEFMVYTRAYYWIQDFKIRSKEWKLALKEYYSDEEFLCSLKLTINYFESTEEYEKCAFLKKIQDLVIKNINTNKNEI